MSAQKVIFINYVIKHVIILCECTLSSLAVTKTITTNHKTFSSLERRSKQVVIKGFLVIPVQ